MRYDSKLVQYFYYALLLRVYELYRTIIYKYSFILQCMYVCMVITYSKGKNQPGKVANPARGQLNRENKLFLVSVRA